VEPGYYRLIKTFDHYHKPVVGTLYYLTHVDADGDYHVIRGGNSGWSLKEDEFHKCFVFAPEGFAERQSSITELMTEIQTMTVEQNQLLLESADAPHIEHGEAAGLAVIGNRSPEVIKAKLKSIKTNFAKVSLSLTKKSAELQSIINEQKAIMEAKTSMLQLQIQQANEQIDVITTYLGEHENLITICKGEPAPVDELIKLRQLILYMDEECGLNCADGGIDISTIKEFDKWISKPKHYNQVIPEQKGIVAMKLRRHKKDYDSGNIFADMEMQDAEKKIYILIRNGKSLYRIFTTLDLGTVFFPRKDEFEEYFYERKWDSEKSEYIRTPLDVGSREYMKSMEAAAADRRRYFKVLILLQGLMDRTKIFRPLPTEGRINLCNQAEYDRYLCFIYDGENLLPTGHIPYEKWLAEANGKIEVGHRVIGNFARSFYGERDSDKKRVLPKSCYQTPMHDRLYTIEGTFGEGLYYDSGMYFLFDREDEVAVKRQFRRGYDYRKPEKRARYQIWREDKFWLNFDAVKLADLKYYVNSRNERHNYINMLPLMNLAIELKEKEEVEEAPFRKLLTGEILKKYTLDLDYVEAKVVELVDWWKYKNRTHRALTSDDSKALRMIVAEFEHRELLETEKSAAQKLDDSDIEKLTQQREDVLAIFQANSNEYVVYRWYNAQNVFACEERWKLSARAAERTFVCSEEREWRVIDKRHLSWRPLYTHERFSKWQINARPNEHLTGKEIQEGVDFLLTALKEKHRCMGLEKDMWGRRTDRKVWGKPLYAYVGKKGTPSLVFTQFHAHIPDRKITGHIETPQISVVGLSFEKKRTGVKFFFNDSRSYDYNWGWIHKGDKDHFMRLLTPSEGSILVEQETIDAVIQEVEACEAAHKFRSEQRELCEPAVSQFTEIITEQHWAKEKAKFFEDYEDEELWEAHKKKLHSPSLYASFMYDLCGCLLENGINPHDMVLKDAAEMAKKFKPFKDNGDRKDLSESIKGLEDYVIDMFFKDKKERLKEQEEDEDGPLLIENDTDDDDDEDSVSVDDVFDVD
jgi:hypothetical protein